MNWADQMLFERFNATLWQRIARYPDFAQELADFRQHVDVLSEACGHLSPMDEHTHRRVLEEHPALTPLDRQCHYTLMDSMAFSKHLKHLHGASPMELECHTQGMPRRTVYLKRTPFVPDAGLANMVYRYGMRRDLPLLLPRRDLRRSTPVSHQYLHVASKGKNPARVPYNVGASSPLVVFDANLLPQLEAPANRVLMLVDPVVHFLAAYESLRVADLLTQRGQGLVSVEKFAHNAHSYEQLLPEDVRRLLFNGQLRSLGYRGTVDVGNRVSVQRFITTTVFSFEMVVIAERYLESLTLLRRLLCLPVEDIVFSLEAPFAPAGATPERYAPPRPPLRPDTIRKIEELQSADMTLYLVANKSLT
jgi:hypothetical protein